MDEKLAKLEDIGFTYVGCWKSIEDGIDCELSELADYRNALYAFSVEDELMYVGKTTQTIRKRLAGYRNPSSTQATNEKNNKNIRKALKGDKRVDIYIFRDMGLMHYGGFHLNLAAGLEDSLILDLEPLWNGGQKDEPDESATIPQKPPPESNPPQTADFVKTLSARLEEAEQKGALSLDVRAGDLHKEVGGYPGSNHRMPRCCNAMRKLMQPGDQVLCKPPKDNGANLKIRYFFPRQKD
ncbi:MAG: GIY-YIG nuclease family protein [Gemmataceae bacterium]